MDAFIFMILSLVIAIKTMNTVETTQSAVNAADCVELNEKTERVSKLNDSYYEDPQAFSKIINMLGFPKRS